MSHLGRSNHRRALVRSLFVATISCALLAIGADGAGAVGFLPAVPATADSTCAFLRQSSTIASMPDGTTIAAWTQGDGACAGGTQVAVAVRPPNGDFGAPQLLSDPALIASDPKLAADPAGNVIAVWVEGGTIRYSLRPVGAGFSVPQTIPGAGPGAAAPAVAYRGDTAVVGWTRALVGGDVAAEVAIKPPLSNAFGLPQSFNTPVAPAADVAVAVTASGAATLTWQTIGTVLDTLHAASRAPADAFVELPTVFTTTANNDAIRRPQVEMSPNGATTLLWTYFDSAGTTSKVLTADRPGGGNFGAVDTISNATVNSGPAGSIDLAVDGAGNAIAIWWATTMQASYKPAGGSFGPVIQNVSAPNFVITIPSVAFDAGGRAIAVWSSPGGPIFGVQGAVLAKGAAAFGPVGEHAQPAAGGDIIDGETPIALDDQGNAVSIWRHALDIDAAAPQIQPGFFRLESAALDTVAPVLAANIPSSGVQDVPINVSATATDRLSAITFTWNFGDGATATGATASHAFTKGGTYTVTATATDAAGNAASVSDKVTIPPIPATGPDPRLTINNLRVSPAAFRAASKGPSVKSGKLKPWTRVTYSLNIPATVRFSFERPRLGRRAGSRCAKPAPSNRRGKRCVRYVAVKGSFSRKRPAGGDRFTFTGRLNGHRLAAGKYRLVARASANGRVGKTAPRSFRILPAARKK
jgi:hypothetical protein